jgi:hypothetical protein
MAFVGPTEATWIRHTEDDPSGHFIFACGKFGRWRFWQKFDTVEWTEEEMLAVDNLFLRCCYVDRPDWTFRKFNVADGNRPALYDASPRSGGPRFQSQSLPEFLARLEAGFIEIHLYGGLGTGHRHCDVCKAEVKSKNVSFGMAVWELIPHYEAEHPEEIAKIRAEQLARMEANRDYYRRRDATYHPELDGPRESRYFIL